MKRFSAVLFALLFVMLCFAGCAKSSFEYTDSATAESVEEYSSDFYEATEWESPEDAGVEELGTGGTDSALSYAGQNNSKLIYTADMDLETTEFDRVARSLEELTGEVGGYFETSRVDNYGTYRSGYYIVRVPAEKFEEFCSGTGNLCQVNSFCKNVENVSETYYDIQARLTTQQTKLERLQELLRQAENMEDIITLESAISETELEIENLTGSLRWYDSLVDFSTVNISLQEVYQLVEPEEPAIGFFARLGAALKRGAANAAENLQDMLLSMAYHWVGWLIFLTVVIVVLVIILRCTRRSRRKNGPAKTQPEKNGEQQKPSV